MKWILKYLRGASHVFIFYISTYLKIKGFTYSTFGGYDDGWKSTAGYNFTLIVGAIR